MVELKEESLKTASSRGNKATSSLVVMEALPVWTSEVKMVAEEVNSAKEEADIRSTNGRPHGTLLTPFR
jgi:hypothetical protein